MEGQGAREHRIAAIAARQGGVISRAQLIAAGLSAKAIDSRVAAGRLHIVHRGVYAVGHTVVGAVGLRWAAVLACGEGAVLSHASAADAWGLVASAARTMHVTVPGRAGRKRRRGIRIHRPESLHPAEMTTLAGLPITTPARTLLDLAAGGLDGRRLEAALDCAERALRLDWAELRRLLERHAGRAGAPALNATLARYVPGSVDTRSKLEEIVLELCDEFAIPRPQVNHVIEGRIRDFYWPDARLVVEADGYGYHRSPTAFNDDRERDVRLTLAGLRTLRFTYDQCTKRREYVQESILAARRAP
jgi:very-short-patch-repair endonuclease/predicted transcriptional regulator of viral defense system